MRFQNTSVEQVDRQLELRSKAARAAQEHTIQSTDKSMDDGQMSIVDHFQGVVADGRKSVSEELEREDKRRREIAAEIENYPRQDFQKTVKGQVELALRKNEEDVKRAQRDEEKALMALKAYRLKYEIDRPAKYPKWRVLHWGIVLLLFFIETIANSQFFGKASPFGLVGGILQAGIISAINVGLGLLSGMTILPKINERKLKGQSTKLLISLAIFIGIFLIIFNLATAHYRVVLEDTPGQAIKLAIGHLVNSPFAINNFDAWLLLFVGLIFTSVAWIEGYKSDDPLREYGHLDREYEAARVENAAMKTRVRQTAVAAYEREKGVLIDAGRQSKMKLAEFESSLSKSKSITKGYREWRDKQQDSLNTLLARYRGYYSEVHRLDNPPAYFHEDYQFAKDEPFLEEDERIQHGIKKAEDLREVVQVLGDRKEKGLEDDADIISQLEDKVDQFYANVEGVSEKENISAEERRQYHQKQPPPGTKDKQDDAEREEHGSE